MVANAVSNVPSLFAVFRESTKGTGPANAAAWAAAEGSTAYRLWHLAAEPDGLVQAAVVDARLSDRIYKHPDLLPIPGLRNGEATAQIPLCGGEAVPADTAQIALTGYMWLLEHCLGGLSRGHRSAISAVTTDVSHTLTTTTEQDEGQFYAFEDDDDAGKAYPRRVLTLPGAGVQTTDEELPWTLATDDVAHACAVAYVDQDALSNPTDANATTVSVFIAKGPSQAHIWEANGCAIELESIEFARGDVPKMSLKIYASYVRPPADGAPSAPTWTGTVQGDAGTVVGINTKFSCHPKGTTSSLTYDAVSAKLTPGVVKTPLNVVTENTSQMQGRAGYRIDPADTILEVQAFLDTTFQDYWDAKTPLIVRYYHAGAPSLGWCVHGSDAVLMKPPQRVGGEGSNLYTLTFELREDRSLDATASNLDRARSKFCLVKY